MRGQRGQTVSRLRDGLLVVVDMIWDCGQHSCYDCRWRAANNSQSVQELAWLYNEENDIRSVIASEQWSSAQAITDPGLAAPRRGLRSARRVGRRVRVDHAVHQVCKAGARVRAQRRRRAQAAVQAGCNGGGGGGGDGGGGERHCCDVLAVQREGKCKVGCCGSDVLCCCAWGELVKSS